jgi:hypothetical protein
VSKLKSRPATQGRGIKTPPVTAERSDGDKHPIFCFQHLQKGFCVSDCDKNEKAALVDTLRKLSQLSWSQIHASHRHGSGCEKIPQQAIKAAIPLHITQDVSLIAFRFCAKASMVGYRSRDVFHICWLDPRFNLYSHG